jgi:hypothetical protein
MTIRFGISTYNDLWSIAQESGLMYTPKPDDDEPKARIAELVRVLLTSTLLGASLPVSVRVAAALLVNSTLSLSKGLAVSVHNLYDELGREASIEVQVKYPFFLAALKAAAGKVPHKRSGNKPRDLARVHLVLDGWLFYALRHRIQASKFQADRSEGAESVKPLILDALANYEQDHRPVVEAYVQAMTRMQKAVDGAVTAEQKTLLALLKNRPKPSSNPNAQSSEPT